MIGKVITLSPNESTNIGKEYIMAHKERWIDFDFEESSIDLAIRTPPLFVVDNICYEPIRQYFIKDGNTTTRLVVLKVCYMEKENVDIHMKYSDVTRYATGFIPGISNENN